MHHRVYTFMAAALLAALSVSGCRTYGEYGSESAKYEQMERVAGILDEELARAEADLNAARAAAASNPEAEMLVETFGGIVEEHARIVDEQKELLEGLSTDSGYRELSRAFGAINMQQQAIHERYERFLQGAYTALSETTDLDNDRPYSSVPPYYNRVAAAHRSLTLTQVLSLVRGGGAPSPMPADSVAGADSLTAL